MSVSLLFIKELEEDQTEIEDVIRSFVCFGFFSPSVLASI